MAKRFDVPQCFGYWDPCVTCDGGPNPESGEVEVPCTWRDRCQSFQDWMVKQGQGISPEVFIKRHGVQAVLKIVSDLERGQTPQPKRKKRKPKRRVISLTPEERKARRYKITRAQLEVFVGILADAFENSDLQWVKKKAMAVIPGCCYRKDHTKKSNYINFYMRKRKGRDRKLMVIRLAPINGGLDAQLPLRKIPEGCPEILRWARWHDPPMLSVLKTCKSDDDFRFVAGLFVSLAEEALDGTDN